VDSMTVGWVRNLIMLIGSGFSLVADASAEMRRRFASPPALSPLPSADGSSDGFARLVAFVTGLLNRLSNWVKGRVLWRPVCENLTLPPPRCCARQNCGSRSLRT
jgi:hypothetical protein